MRTARCLPYARHIRRYRTATVPHRHRASGCHEPHRRYRHPPAASSSMPADRMQARPGKQNFRKVPRWPRSRSAGQRGPTIVNFSLPTSTARLRRSHSDPAISGDLASRCFLAKGEFGRPCDRENMLPAALYRRSARHNLRRLSREDIRSESRDPHRPYSPCCPSSSMQQQMQKGLPSCSAPCRTVRWEMSST